MHKCYVRSEDAEKAARAWAATKGWKGARGGWIYSPTSATSPARAIVQGWFNLYSTYRADILNYMTRRLTAFDSWDALVNTPAMYRPTIRPRSWRERFLADAYDVHQERRGDPRRAYRGIAAAA